MNLPLALGAATGAYFLAKKMGVLGAEAAETTGSPDHTATEGSPLEGAKPDQAGRAPSSVTAIKNASTTKPLAAAVGSKPAPKPVAVAVPKTSSIVAPKKNTEVLVSKVAAPKKVSATEAQSRVATAKTTIAPDLRW